MNLLSTEIKQLIIDTLNLEGMTPEEIDAEAPLFGDGLGLALKNRYGVVLSAESQDMRQHFYSVETLTKFVSAQRSQ